MTHATRRLWFYGLPLFFSALVVGGLALGLLAREQARVEEREAAAYESRRAAVEARVRLIAENIELLISDVQATLMAGLLSVPEADAQDFMTGWREANPLIREVFAVDADGTLRWGGENPTTRAWLGTAPWSAGAASRSVRAEPPITARGEVAEMKVAIGRVGARSETLSNVGQYQRARQDVQRLASQLPARGQNSVMKSTDDLMTRAEVYGDSVSHFTAESGTEAPGSFAAAVPAPASLEVNATDHIEGVAESSGWTSWRDGNEGPHVYAWRALAAGGRIGLELDLDAIRPRLQELFPSGEAGVRFRFAESPAVESGAVRMQIPIAERLLPGWTVIGEMAGMPASSTSLFAPGAAIIALLVLAIMVAGVALLRQARRSEVEAAIKTSFVANVSHELKTPLTTIRLYAELLAQGRVRDERKRADYLAVIGEEAQRLARLVGNVLDFSRLEQGAKRYELTDFDLAAELRALVEAHAPRLAAAGLTPVVEAPGRLPVTSDRDAVVQVLLNLLDNACKYAASGRELTLTAVGDTTGGARVTVADRGPGVPEAQRERIFEKFHRVDERLTAERGGAGLGLSIARRLARGLGGDLTYRPHAGGGAEFVFTLGSISG